MSIIPIGRNRMINIADAGATRGTIHYNIMDSFGMPDQDTNRDRRIETKQTERGKQLPSCVDPSVCPIRSKQVN